MSASNAASLTPKELFRLLVKHRRLWIAPAVAGAIVAGILSMAAPRNWKASQGLIIRAETAGYAGQRLGKFTDLSEMKTVQETVLEVARSKSVVQDTLNRVGPPADYKTPSAWPTAQDVVDFRGQLTVAPPSGAEFGQTEVFYISVLDKDQSRAADLVRSLCTVVESRMQELRNQQAGSMLAELEQSVSAAQTQLDADTRQLAEFEGKVGADLGELRTLLSSVSGQGELSRQAAALEAELRQSVSTRRQREALLENLNAAADNPERLLATPNSFLATQPALERLKQGLVDAQLATAELQSTRTATHPFVVASREAVDHIRQELRNELPTAIAGLQTELRLANQRESRLQAELADLKQRLQALAPLRAEYATLIANVEGQTRLLEAAETQKAEAFARQIGAQSASVLGRIDEVERSARPVGPGRSLIAAAGGFAGLVLGIGLVFLFHAPHAFSRVYAGPGRRASDRAAAAFRSRRAGAGATDRRAASNGVGGMTATI